MKLTETIVYKGYDDDFDASYIFKLDIDDNDTPYFIGLPEKDYWCDEEHLNMIIKQLQAMKKRRKSND